MNTLIEQEFDEETKKYWFYRKDWKFLHNIDTFSYSVTFYNNFARDTSDPNALLFRSWLNDLKVTCTDGYDEDLLVIKDLPDIDDITLTYSVGSFAGYYNNRLTVPEYFDIFIADTVPTIDTSHIIVQIRSKPLWLIGPARAFEYSYRIRQSIAKYLKLTISEVKENRIDYCWHTNYLSNPEKFFRIDNFSAMQVSSFKDSYYHYKFKPNNEYESDYVSLGRRGSKCFVRIYLKTKEVVEQGYKPWFLNIWLLNNMISRYDYYVLSNLYALRNWNCIDLMRLQFYLDYGDNQFYKDMIIEYFESYFKKGGVNQNSVAKLADQLTPRVTIIMNNEFQTTRKMTKTFCLVDHKKNDKFGVYKRIYDILDNHNLITDYLTHSTLRLVIPSENDTNKARADYCEYWKRLRNTKIIDCYKKDYPVKLLRDYSRNLNWELMKSRFIHSSINFSLYTYGVNKDIALEDYEQLLTLLNDNDIQKANNYKYKRSKQLYPSDFRDKLEGLDGY